MRRYLLLPSILGIVAMTAMNPNPPPSAARCSKPGYPLVRPPEVVALLVRPLPDTVVTVAGVGITSRTDRSASDFPNMPRLPRTGDPVAGQYAVVERSSAATIEPGRTVVLVPWGYRADCQLVAWEASARWMPIDTTVFVRARRRPGSESSGPSTVLDVPNAYWEAFPHERFRLYRRDHRSMGALTALELWNLYQFLPTPAELEVRDGNALTRIDEWTRDHPDLTRRYPAPEIVRAVRRLLDRRP